MLCRIGRNLPRFAGPQISSSAVCSCPEVVAACPEVVAACKQQLDCILAYRAAVASAVARTAFALPAPEAAHATNLHFLLPF